MTEPSRKIFPALKSQPFETWQVGAVRLPALGSTGRRNPFRAWVALCLNLDSGRSGFGAGARGGAPVAAGELLSRAGASGGPGRRGSRWPTWPGPDLDALLSPHGVAVEVQPELPELSGVLAKFQQHMGPEDDPRPGPLTGAGVTLERLAAFARAAAGFLNASGWRHLNHEDRVRIEAPDVEPELRYFVLDHHGGKPDPVLSFFPVGRGVVSGFRSRSEDFDWPGKTTSRRGRSALEEEEDSVGEGLWVEVALLKPWDSAPGGRRSLGAAWARLGPVDGSFRGRCCLGPETSAVRTTGSSPSSKGLLAALTVLAEGDLDTGRWETQVSTAEGPVRFVLSLPELLEPPDDLPTRALAALLERSMGRWKDHCRRRFVS